MAESTFVCNQIRCESCCLSRVNDLYIQPRRGGATKPSTLEFPQIQGSHDKPKPHSMDPDSRPDFYESRYSNKLRDHTKGRITSPLLAVTLVLQETSDIVSELHHHDLPPRGAEQQAQDRLLLRRTTLSDDIAIYLDRNTRQKYLLKRSRHREYVVSIFVLEVVRFRLAQTMEGNNFASTVKTWEEIVELTHCLYQLIESGPGLQPKSFCIHWHKGVTAYFQRLLDPFRRCKVVVAYF